MIKMRRKSRIYAEFVPSTVLDILALDVLFVLAHYCAARSTKLARGAVESEMFLLS